MSQCCELLIKLKGALSESQWNKAEEAARGVWPALTEWSIDTEDDDGKLLSITSSGVGNLTGGMTEEACVTWLRQSIWEAIDRCVEVSVTFVNLSPGVEYDHVSTADDYHRWNAERISKKE